VYLAYVDESGDRGANGSISYSLGCLLLPAAAWPTVFDDVIDYRRFLRAAFKIPIRAEIKANHLIRGAGAFRGLNETSRHAIYRQSLRLMPKLGFEAFAIVIRKLELAAVDPSRDPREIAWEYLFQRLERYSTKGKTPLLLIHDEGEAPVIRKLARKARRAGTAGSRIGTGMLRVPARQVIEDPVAKQSHQSFFLQFADLVAFAAYRWHYPPPAGLAVPVVPQNMWDELGTARLAAVNKYSGGPPGIVDYP